MRFPGCVCDIDRELRRGRCGLAAEEAHLIYAAGCICSFRSSLWLSVTFFVSDSCEDRPWRSHTPQHIYWQAKEMRLFWNHRMIPKMSQLFAVFPMIPKMSHFWGSSVYYKVMWYSVCCEYKAYSKLEAVGADADLGILLANFFFYKMYVVHTLRTGHIRGSHWCFQFSVRICTGSVKMHMTLKHMCDTATIGKVGKP